MPDTQSYFPDPEAQANYRQQLVEIFPERCGTIDPNLPLCSRVWQAAGWIAVKADAGAVTESEGIEEAQILAKEYDKDCISGISGGGRGKCGHL